MTGVGLVSCIVYYERDLGNYTVTLRGVVLLLVIVAAFQFLKGAVTRPRTRKVRLSAADPQKVAQLQKILAPSRGVPGAPGNFIYRRWTQEGAGDPVPLEMIDPLEHTQHPPVGKTEEPLAYGRDYE